MKENWAELCASIENGGAKRKLIIDCDAGTDDAEAIMMCLNCPHVDVVAITCVNGNTGVDQVAKNVQRILAVCERPEIPIYVGAFAPLLRPIHDAHYFHGNDGLGDCTQNDAPRSDEPPLQEEDAISALIRICKEGLVHPTHHEGHDMSMATVASKLRGEADAQWAKAKDLAANKRYAAAAKVEGDAELINARATSFERASGLQDGGDACATVEILALGPLTNLALAARTNVEFPATVKRLFVMGGTSAARGNVPFNGTAEFNAFADPEAFAVTLNSFPHPVLITWEACIAHMQLFETTDKWRKKDTKKGRFIFGIQQHPRSILEVSREHWVPADPLAAAVCLYPDIVTKAGAVLRNVTMELKGSECYAQSVVDVDGKNSTVANTWLVSDVDDARFVEILATMCDE